MTAGVGAGSLPCEAVLFDLDGVLIGSTGAVEKHWQLWADEVGIDVAPILEVAHGRRTADVVREFAPHLDADAEAARIEAREALDVEGIVPLPGAAALLRSLPDDGWAVVTSGTRDLARSRLTAAGLPIPDVLVCAEDVTLGKPDPEGYRRAAERLGVAPAASVVIEDAPPGLAAGRAAGARVLALLTSHPADDLGDADAVLDSLASVHARLRPDGRLERLEFADPRGDGQAVPRERDVAPGSGGGTCDAAEGSAPGAGGRGATRGKAETVVAEPPDAGGHGASAVAIEALAPEQDGAAADLLAEALLDDPGLAWVCPGRDGRRRMLRSAYAAWLRLLRRHGASLRCAVVDGEVVGVVTSLHSERVPSLPRSALALAPPMLRAGPATPVRALAWARRMDRVHPREPHLYLDLLAVHPEHQGRRVGRALLDVVARDADDLGLPLILSTNGPETVGFYRSAGFAVERELRLAPKIPAWCLRRPPGGRNG